jgi:hypothetical protein
MALAKYADDKFLNVRRDRHRDGDGDGDDAPIRDYDH